MSSQDGSKGNYAGRRTRQSAKERQRKEKSMVEALKITREMKESREEKVDEIVSRINKNIKYAAAHGEHRAFFDCGKDNMIEAPFYAEVRARFEKAGYRIVPTGYIGGVWQRTEDIEW